MEGNQTVIMMVGIALLMALMILPQWQARRRQKKQMESIQAGTKIVTIGGIIGEVRYINRDENRARIEISPGVEIECLANAISRPVEPTEAPKETDDSFAAEEG